MGSATFPPLVPTELSALLWGQASREIPGIRSSENSGGMRVTISVAWLGGPSK
jgi:hypothetical protein